MRGEDKETGRQGDGETGRRGDGETGLNGVDLIASQVRSVRFSRFVSLSVGSSANAGFLRPGGAQIYQPGAERSAAPGARNRNTLALEGQHKCRANSKIASLFRPFRAEDVFLGRILRYGCPYGASEKAQHVSDRIRGLRLRPRTLRVTVNLRVAMSLSPRHSRRGWWRMGGVIVGKRRLFSGAEYPHKELNGGSSGNSGRAGIVPLFVTVRRTRKVFVPFVLPNTSTNFLTAL